jgi:hypothetical protein
MSDKHPAWITKAAEAIWDRCYAGDQGTATSMEIMAIIAKHVPKEDQPAVPFPEHAAFQASVKEWRTFSRQKRGGRAIPPMTLKKHNALFLKWGPEASIASIAQSIERNWSGLFPAEGERKAAVVVRPAVPMGKA